MFFCSQINVSAKRMTTRLLVVASLFGLSFSAVITARQDAPTENLPLTAATGVNVPLPTNAFGGGIEGAAVNAKGDVFAADYRGESGAQPNHAFAFFNQVDGAGANVLDLNANPFFVVTDDGVANKPLLAGARFLPDNRLLLAG